jgi:hypothetical protein
MNRKRRVGMGELLVVLAIDAAHAWCDGMGRRRHEVEGGGSQKGTIV